MRPWLVGVVMCAPLLCMPPAAADPVQDSRFFQILDQYKIGYSSRQDAIAAAGSACAALDRGASYGQLQTAGLSAPGQAGPGAWTLRDADQFLFAATSAYCPQYANLVPAESLR